MANISTGVVFSENISINFFQGWGLWRKNRIEPGKHSPHPTHPTRSLSGDCTIKENLSWARSGGPTIGVTAGEEGKQRGWGACMELLSRVCPSLSPKQRPGVPGLESVWTACLFSQGLRLDSDSGSTPLSNQESQGWVLLSEGQVDWCWKGNTTWRREPAETRKRTKPSGLPGERTWGAGGSGRPWLPSRHPMDSRPSQPRFHPQQPISCSSPAAREIIKEI